MLNKIDDMYKIVTRALAGNGFVRLILTFSIDGQETILVDEWDGFETRLTSSEDKKLFTQVLEKTLSLDGRADFEFHVMMDEGPRVTKMSLLPEKHSLDNVIKLFN